MRVYNQLSTPCQTKETHLAQKHSIDGTYCDTKAKKATIIATFF